MGAVGVDGHKYPSRTLSAAERAVASALCTGASVSEVVDALGVSRGAVGCVSKALRREQYQHTSR